MGNNRSQINHYGGIIQPAQILQKGLPLPFFEGRICVWTKVGAQSSQGGAFKEILEPGTHFLGKYRLFRDAKATKIDRRKKTLLVQSYGDFSIAQPVPGHGRFNAGCRG